MPGSLVFTALFPAGEADGSAAVRICSTLGCRLPAGRPEGIGWKALRPCSTPGCRLPTGAPDTGAPGVLGGFASAAARNCSIVCARLLVSGPGAEGSALVGSCSTPCVGEGVAGGLTNTLRRVGSDRWGVVAGCSTPSVGAVPPLCCAPGSCGS